MWRAHIKVAHVQSQACLHEMKTMSYKDTVPFIMCDFESKQFHLDVFGVLTLVLLFGFVMHGLDVWHSPRKNPTNSNIATMSRAKLNHPTQRNGLIPGICTTRAQTPSKILWTLLCSCSASANCPMYISRGQSSIQTNISRASAMWPKLHVTF